MDSSIEMGLREQNEVRYLSVSEFDAIVGEEGHIRNLYAYWPRLGIDIRPNPPVQVGSVSWMLEFPEGTARALVAAGLQAWKQWYGSDARQAISQLEDAQRHFDRTRPSTNPAPRLLLRISPELFHALSHGTYSDWSQELWEPREEDVRELQQGSVEALQRILSRKGVGYIDVGTQYDLEITPLPDVQS